METILNAVDLTRFSPVSAIAAISTRGRRLPPSRVGPLASGNVCSVEERHITFLDGPETSGGIAAVPVRWYIVGGPIYHTAAQFTEAELRAEVESRGLADRVGFVGFVTDTVPIYRSLDVVLHASTLPEPFGLTVAEAMACGRAVIVSSAGGAAELFTDGIDALGIVPGNAEQLASSVRRLAENPDLRVRLGTAARSIAIASASMRIAMGADCVGCISRSEIRES